ncbi:MAG: 4Fe-4S binding protein [Clostridiales Family XIII bacterium]|jgi:2-oxoglutarate ferredoxin oxidoreductase subunit delta|nr:4Fe-4S binding protein [Clostridiales Family XIII bacterium]
MPQIFVKIDAEKCKGCNLCVEACPKKILSSGRDARNKYGYRAVTANGSEDCTGCLNCALMCPDGAIAVYKRQ